MKTLKKNIFQLCCVVLFFCCNAIQNQSANKTKRPPNIIFIFADDLGYGDLGCFGARDIKTPNIDRMAKEGITFTSFYSASSVSSPSRAGFLTGRLPQRMGVNGVFFPQSFTGMPSEEVTIAELLKSKGYKTGIIGKWHLGHRPQFLPLQQGFDEYYGIPYSNDMHNVVYMDGNDIVEHHIDQAEMTKRFHEKSLSFVTRHRDDPFFLFLSHAMPHVPLYVSEQFKGSSKRGLYGDVIQEMDWGVGAIIDTLDKLNLLENTLIIFTSDNGPWSVMEDHGGSSGGLRQGKFYTFEGGMRVPTVALWKGTIPEGLVNNDLASQMDWFPTFAALADIALPKDRAIDGVDISKVLFGKGKRAKDSYLFFSGEQLMGYRKGQWKVKMPFAGFERQRWKQGEPAHDTLLFDLEKDPGEKNNLYSTNKKLARTLIEEMNKEYAAMGELPPSLIVRNPADEGHYEYLKNKHKK